MAAAAETLCLVVGGRSSVGLLDLHPRSQSELACFIEDLDDELTSWCDDQAKRFVHRRLLVVFRHDHVQDWQTEGGGLAGSGLSTTHQVALHHHEFYCKLLDRSWLRVAGFTDVLQQEVAQAGFLECLQTFESFHSVSRGLDFDFVKLVEVDAGSDTTAEHLVLIGGRFWWHINLARLVVCKNDF